jgi:hypothetical protein
LHGVDEAGADMDLGLEAVLGFTHAPMAWAAVMSGAAAASRSQMIFPIMARLYWKSPKVIGHIGGLITIADIALQARL